MGSGRRENWWCSGFDGCESPGDIELKLEEVDRGRLKIGEMARIRVDAIPEKEFTAALDWISPIASVNFRGPWMQEEPGPAAPARHERYRGNRH